MRRVSDVLNNLLKADIEELPAPAYTGNAGHYRVMMGVAAMRTHTADAGWQLTTGLRSAGYILAGPGLDLPESDTQEIIRRLHPNMLVVQDKREWLGHTARQKKRANSMMFHNVHVLKDLHSIFKVTVLKDAQQKPQFHRDSADEIGAHAWITYYHPDIVKHVAPYVRKEHLVRTYHTVDVDQCFPLYPSQLRQKAIISGAVSGAYPLRQILLANASICDLHVHKHPGYQADVCHTPSYLKLLNNFKISVATSSRFGYSLRKIIEATAMGCRVITDLPVDDVLPEIDDNLHRIPQYALQSNPRELVRTVRNMIEELSSSYDFERQEHFASLARSYYDYRVAGKRLAGNLEKLRSSYADQNV